MKYVHHTRGAGETEDLAFRLAQKLRAGDIVCLYGDLGSGKTAFVRGLARGLGCAQPVTSPTFTIVNEYQGRLPLFHLDLFRLSGWDELIELGWDDYQARGGVTAVEWAERLDKPPRCYRVKLTPGRGEDDRRVTALDPDGNEVSL